MPRPRLERPEYRLHPRAGARGTVWQIRWTEGRKGHTLSTGQATEPAARRWLDQWIAGQETPLPPSEPTIAEILDGYLAHRKGHVQAYARLEFAAKAIKRLVGNLEPPHLGERMFWERRKKEGVGPGTIIRDGKTLRAALHYAVRKHWIAKAPFVDLPRRPAPKERWLTPEEAEKLIRACKTPHVRLFILLALNTAARKTALVELTWDRVDFERKLIHLELPGRALETKRRATVPITGSLIGELQQAKLAAVSDHVLEFRGKKAGEPKKAFERAVRDAGIPSCSPHSLRRTAATWMVIGGVPLAEVARFLGDSEAVVERIYGKHSPDYLKRAAAALESSFRGLSVHANESPRQTAASNGRKTRRTKRVTG